jgi:3',5'-cyclic-nucleotide phosphodiesterase
MAKVLISCADSTLPVAITEHDLYLGRSTDEIELVGNFIGLPDKEVSRRHARILKQNNRYLLQDLNSTNGTELDGRLIEPGSLYPLESGNMILLGQTELVVQLEEDSDRPSYSLSQSVSSSLGSVKMDANGARIGEPEGDEVAAYDAGASVSMVIDASRLMAELKGAGREVSAERDELLRRLSLMTQVSIALGATKDRNALCKKITQCIFDIFQQGDHVSVLLFESGKTHLREILSESRDVTATGVAKARVSKTIVNEVVKNRHSLLLLDALGDERFKQQESVIDLVLRSVMCAPLLYEDEVLGLIQIDSKKGPNQFRKEDLEILTAIASQMAIAFKNLQLYSEIETLFEGFVTASVQVIEARDPVTAGHSFRVAEYTQNLARSVDRIDNGGFKSVKFSPDQMREIRYAALLHDFGKVGVRENVLTKAKKLHEHELELLQQRFKYARACLEKETFFKLVQIQEEQSLSPEEFGIRRQIFEAELKRESDLLAGFLDSILKANEPAITADKISGLEKIAQYLFRDGEELHMPLLTPFEFSTLSLSKGSLNPDERIEIESHVSHTYAFLNLIPWTGNLGRVPEIAYAHHEKLDGSGYPRQLTAEQIPLPSKIMTVADIFDALTSGDRPYKHGLSTDKALDILHTEAKNGKIDKNLLTIFIESNSFVISG